MGNHPGNHQASKDDSWEEVDSLAAQCCGGQKMVIIQGGFKGIQEAPEDPLGGRQED